LFCDYIIAWAGHVAHMSEVRNVHKIWVGKREGMRIGTRDQWQALVNMVVNLWVPQKAGNLLTSFMPWLLYP